MFVRILRDRRWSSGRVLFAGFGGLLALMGLSGADAIVVLRQAKITHTAMRHKFLTRGHSLDQIRSGIYAAGTFARDYVQATGPAAAEELRAKLRATQRETETALEDCARSLSVEDAATF